jgi:quercetin 2,3-dioxygenase
MWGNFVGRSHDDIARYRQLWEDAEERFGAVHEYLGSAARLPTPPLPTTPLWPHSLPERKERR